MPLRKHLITNTDSLSRVERDRLHSCLKRRRRQRLAQRWRSELARRFAAGDPAAARALWWWGVRRKGILANESTGWANLVKARAVLAQKRAEGKALDERDRQLRAAGIEPPERPPTPYARRQRRIRRIKLAQFPENLSARDRLMLARNS